MRFLSFSASLVIALVLVGGCGSVADSPIRGNTLEVVATIPHDRAAYTQGFLFHDGFLYESTGLYGSSSVRKIDPATGEILKKHDLDPRFFGEGLTALGDRLFQVTWREGTGFIYEASDLQPVGSFRYEGEGWGLTTDGASLILSDGTYRLRYLDPETFEVVRTVDVSDGGRVIFAINELEWVQGEIWANIWQEENVARIDPESGAVVGWVNVESFMSSWQRWRGAEVANGIAYDSVSDRLWVTGKRWPHIFEVRNPR
jgi:glutaminyl-peptide cyclotransferase